MKLYFYRGQHPNFGDELNLLLMPKIFGTLLDDGGDNKLLLAIGSILFDSHPKEMTKIVFGSGYGGYTPPPSLNERWQVYCVRGPRSASVCGIDPEKVAGDAAILINLYRDTTVPKTIRCSFMPHWQSIRRGHWRQACKLAGLHYLDPRRPVGELLHELSASELVVTEAMHGAIVADALRVPWVAVKPFHDVHQFKWFDWAEALDLKLSPLALIPSSLLEARVARGKLVEDDPVTPTGIRLLANKVVDAPFVAAAAASLRLAARREAQLSSDAALNRVLDKLQTSAERIKMDHG